MIVGDPTVASVHPPRVKTELVVSVNVPRAEVKTFKLADPVSVPVNPVLNVF